MTDQTLNDRALRAGIIPEFRDLFGVTQTATDETKLALLQAMGLDGDDIAPTPLLPRWLARRGEGGRGAPSPFLKFRASSV